jgi:hypothetical protein
MFVRRLLKAYIMVVLISIKEIILALSFLSLSTNEIITLINQN